MSDDRWTTASSEIGAVWAESQRPQRPISTATLPQLVKAGDLRELKRALAAEPERVNEVDEDGNSALMTSVDVGRIDICRHLLSIKHVAVDLVNKLGHTALYRASGFSSELVHALAAHGADVNFSCEGVTALDVAAIRAVSDYEMHKALLFRGASMTLLAAACLGNLEEVQKFLQRGVHPDEAKDGDGFTALWYAASIGYASIVEAMLQRGACIDITPGPDGETPLWVASRRGHLECVRVLVHAGANKNISATGDHPKHKGKPIDVVCDSSDADARPKNKDAIVALLKD